MQGVDLREVEEEGLTFAPGQEVSSSDVPRLQVRRNGAHSEEWRLDAVQVTLEDICSRIRHKYITYKIH